MNSKHCPYCNCTKNIIKFGTQAGKQRYFCKRCGKTFQNKARPSRLQDLIWNDFIYNKMTLESLSTKYHKSKNTISKIVNSIEINIEVDLSQLTESEKAKIEVIIMDATYFKKNDGNIAVVDAKNGRLLYFKALGKAESNTAYEIAIDTLLAANIHPKACVIDGRKGVREMLEEKGILVQYCLFHVLLMRNQCLTRNPDLKPNIELREIVGYLCHRGGDANRTTFYAMIAGWELRYGMWLIEKDDKGNYSHEKTRRLFFSIKRNMHWYFTYQEYPELHIPKTSNRIEGKFGNVKTELKIHRGYSKQLRNKILFSLLSGRTGVKNN